MKKNTLSVINRGMNRIQRSINPDSTSTILYKHFPSGMEVALAVKVPNRARKADHALSLQELNSMGINSRAGAYITGMSPSYAAKLMKK